MGEEIACPACAGPASSIAVGYFHACALTATGGVECWGDDTSGELGNGSTTSSAAPVAVSGLASGVAAISGGWETTCALTSSGGVLCWGYNQHGQLGDGTTTDSAVPVQVKGLGPVAAIAAGAAHACAVTTGGGLQCWGSNGSGELGTGTLADSHVPVAVSGLSSGVVAVGGGASHTCALTASGGVVCWGSNAKGQLGNGSGADSSVPVAVTGLGSGVKAIAVGDDHACALSTGGGVLCWGDGFLGDLGDGSYSGSPVPVPVSGLGSGVTAIASGGYHVCALTAAGAQCWGDDGYGQLGDGSTGDATTPVAVSGLAPGVTAIAAGGFHTCATTATGVQCWGDDGAGGQTAVPTTVPGL